MATVLIELHGGEGIVRRDDGETVLTHHVTLDWGQPLHGEPGLGYRDAAGAFVHRPMPAEYPHHPVTDAAEPCPVCGAVQYDEYFPTEEWRAGRGTKGADTFVPSPLVVCRVCGHQEQAGAIQRYALSLKRLRLQGRRCVGRERHPDPLGGHS